MSLESCIYEGWVRHRRFSPKAHEFRYKLFMMYLDLDKLDEVLNLSAFWSKKRCAPARFSRKDFLGDTGLSIKEAVVQLVNKTTQANFSGRVFMLSNLRYFGYLMNPLSVYYCFDEQNRLQYIVAEVTNTPWRERHAYVLKCDPEKQKQKIRFDKQFHVSPLNEMAMQYYWRSSTPDTNMSIHLENWQSDNKVMDATLALRASAISRERLNALLWRFPWMSAKTILAIYWEAAKIWLKGVPYVSHPGRKIASP